MQPTSVLCQCSLEVTAMHPLPPFPLCTDGSCARQHVISRLYLTALDSERVGGAGESESPTSSLRDAPAQASLTLRERCDGPRCVLMPAPGRVSCFQGSQSSWRQDLPVRLCVVNYAQDTVTCMLVDPETDGDFACGVPVCNFSRCSFKRLRFWCMID
jgi:hypothetical protein